MDKSAKYTEEQRKYFEGIIQDISQHKDFGKRNPVDLGIECGYGEDEVMKMIKMLSAMGDEEEYSEKYFFLVRNKGTRHIVSVDIRTWKVTVLHEVKGFNEHNNIFSISGSVFAWVLDNNKKTVMWENLETGKTGKFLSDIDIYSVLVLEDGIVAAGKDRLVKFGSDGTIVKSQKKYMGYNMTLLANKDKIYCFDQNKIYAISRDLKGELSNIYERHITNDLTLWPSQILEVGMDRHNVFCYSWYQENTSLFHTGSFYERFSEENGVEKTGMAFVSNRLSCVVKDIVTEGYMLLGDCIYERKALLEKSYFLPGSIEKICRMNRKLISKQIIGIFSKDIIIGLTDQGEDDAIIKIDLKNERKPVVLPIK